MENTIFILITLFLIGLILAFALFIGLRAKSYLRIRSWQKRLGLKKHQIIFNQLYNQLDGFHVSREARKTQDAIEYTYGEIEFVPFIALLSLVNPDSNTVFYDLGSGTGKAVLACAMMYPVKQSVGIELLPPLYQVACHQAALLALEPIFEQKAQCVKFILGDFLECDLNEATLIFVNSTTLLGSVWTQLGVRLNNLPNLQTLISTSKPLIPHDAFRVTCTKIEVSWGIVEVYIHTKKHPS